MAGELERGLLGRVRALGDGRFLIPRAVYAQLQHDPLPLARGVRLVPVREGSGLIGMRLHGVRAGSLVRVLGLEEGDLLRAVNGQALSSASATLSVVRGLGDTQQVELLVTREGRPLTLTWQVE